MLSAESGINSTSFRFQLEFWGYHRYIPSWMSNCYLEILPVRLQTHVSGWNRSGELTHLRSFRPSCNTNDAENKKNAVIHLKQWAAAAYLWSCELPCWNLFSSSPCPILKCYHILICDRVEPVGLGEVQEEMRSNRALISLKLSAHTAALPWGIPLVTPWADRDGTITCAHF